MRLALLALITGCSFSGPPAGGVADQPDASTTTTATPDAPTTTTPDAPVTPSFAPCATTDTDGLVACYEFEDNFAAAGKIHDSSANHFDANTTGLQVTMRGTGEAAMVTPTSSTYVPQNPAIDRPAGFTFAMWAKPSSLPAEGGVMGLLDHENQYAMDFGKSSGSVTMRCILTGLSFYEWVDGVTANTWSMYACTWDGTNLCAYRWTSPTSHTSNCFEPDEAPADVGINGLALGSLSSNAAPTFPLSGALDSIHIYDHALTEQGLCTAVGQGTGCM